MRVGVNTLFMIPGEVGGSETYLRRTLMAMAENHPDVSLVLFTNLENEPLLRAEWSGFEQVEFVPLAFHAANRYMRIVREQTELPLKAVRAGLDVLWSPGYTAPCFSGGPQVVSILDMQYKAHPEDLGFVARLTTGVLVRMAAARCRRIIAISYFARDEIIKYTSATPAKVDVTPLGVCEDFSKNRPEDEIQEAIRRLLGTDAPYILAVSNTYPHKNIHEAVRAYGELMDAIPHRLVLVGRPRLGEPSVEAACAVVRDPTRITRVDYVAEQRDLIALYQGADLFVFPSLYEGFGLPPLEAMMAGVPVVAARIASITEVCKGAVVYFDHETEGSLAKTIRATLKWPQEQRRQKTALARRLAREYNWKNTARATVASLRSALSEVLKKRS